MIGAQNIYISPAAFCTASQCLQNVNGKKQLHDLSQQALDQEWLIAFAMIAFA